DSTDSARVHTHPEFLNTGPYIVLATSRGVLGQRGLHVQLYRNQPRPDVDTGQYYDVSEEIIGEFTREIPGYDLIRPAIAAGRDRLHIVAELVSDGEKRRVYLGFGLQK